MPQPQVEPDEPALDGSPSIVAINGALRALSRAARTLARDPADAGLRRLLTDYRGLLESALTQHGAVTLSVRPFELLNEGETVYRDTSRERSLAFKLFSDGVRTVTLRPSIPWVESVRLLEAFALRFVSSSPREDDLVTVLRRNAFTCVELTTAERFVPTEDHPEPELPPPPTRVLAPPDFDLPLPEGGPAAWTHREIPPRWVEAMQAEEHDNQLAALGARLAITLVREANGPASPLTNAELVATLREVRDLCLTEGAVMPLLALVRELKQQHGIGAHVLGAVVAETATRQALAQLIDGLPPELLDAPPGFAELVFELPGDPMAHLVDILNATEDPRLLRVLQGVLVGLGKKSSESLIHMLPSANTHSASQIVSALLVSAPEQALHAATELSKEELPASHLKALDILERAPRSQQQSDLLVGFAQSPSEDVFARAAEVMAAVKDRRGYDVIVRQVEARAARGLGAHAADTAGAALANLAPTVALGHFRGWVQSKGGLLGKLRESEQDLTLQRVAVTGLALLPMPDAEALIKELHGRTQNESLKAHCLSSMSKRRKLGVGHGA